MSPVQVRPAALKIFVYLKGDRLNLTKREEKILEGGEGPGPQKAMEILVALGDIYEADRLIPVESAQIAGVSYKTMGDAGLEFIEDFSKKAEVKVKSMLNPAGMDLDNKHYESDEFRNKQKRLIEAYRSMGIELSCTCTPYLAGNKPEKGEHIAWSESSAVSYANSVLGARTNREGGPSALMAAVIGKTPYYGLHIKENRSPDIVFEIKGEVPAALLGYKIGGIVGDDIPYFRGIRYDNDELKSLGAAMAATGSVALYHVKNITPEWNDFSTEDLETITITEKDIQEIKDKIITDEEPEVIVLGCPHLSSEELKDIAEILDDKEPAEGPDLLVYTSRYVVNKVPEAVKSIKRYGEVITDTCMVVSPLEDKYKVAATNSGKAAAYLPKLAGQKVIYADTKTLLEMIA
ncbi:MAG: aconitase X [Thermoplasmata archaeon]